MKQFIVPALIIFLLPSCRVLTDGQMNNIHEFAKAADNCADFPGALVEKRAALHVDDQLLRISQFGDTGLVLRNVRAARSNYLKVVGISKQFDLSILLIKDYAKLLLRLSSDQPADEFQENTQTLGRKLTGLIDQYDSIARKPIPSEIGGQIADILTAMGNRYIKNRQAKALKSIIPSADTIIRIMSSNLVEVLGNDFTDNHGQQHPGLQQLIENDLENFIQDFNSNIILPNPSRLNYFSTRYYYDRLEEFEQLSQVRRRVIESSQALAAAHTALSGHIQKKENLRELIKQTQDLVAVVQECKKGLFFSSSSK
jgi:hypothetical protein